MFSDTVRSFSGILYFFSECNFHFFLHWLSSDTLLSLDWVLGPAHSYAVCTYETRYWAQPFPMQFEHTRQLAPTLCIIIILIEIHFSHFLIWKINNKIFCIQILLTFLFKFFFGCGIIDLCRILLILVFKTLLFY